MALYNSPQLMGGGITGEGGLWNYITNVSGMSRDGTVWTNWGGSQVKFKMTRSGIIKLGFVSSGSTSSGTATYGIEGGTTYSYTLPSTSDANQCFLMVALRVHKDDFVVINPIKGCYGFTASEQWAWMWLDD